MFSANSHIYISGPDLSVKPNCYNPDCLLDISTLLVSLKFALSTLFPISINSSPIYLCRPRNLKKSLTSLSLSLILHHFLSKSCQVYLQNIPVVHITYTGRCLVQTTSISLMDYCKSFLSNLSACTLYAFSVQKPDLRHPKANLWSPPSTHTYTCKKQQQKNLFSSLFHLSKWALHPCRSTGLKSIESTFTPVFLMQPIFTSCWLCLENHIQNTITIQYLPHYISDLSHHHVWIIVAVS